MMSNNELTDNLKIINHKFSAIIFNSIQQFGQKEGRNKAIELILKDVKLMALVKKSLKAEHKLILDKKFEDLIECLIDMNDLNRIKAKLDFVQDIRLGI